MQSLAVLETKLYSPKWRPGLVSRTRLIERIRQGTDLQLTLVSAPAGFGKTTLLAEWLAQRSDSDAPVGWVSLDRSENEPALFWAYVIRALQKVWPGVGAEALVMLQSPLQAPTASVLTSLINEIIGIDRDFILILDDYHVIEAPAVHIGVTFLLDHLPPRMHVVIASRSEPMLPLARLRARGQVTELRAADLRFRPDEASAFLNQVMALDLSATDVSTLETRTEGWIAGLKLAALSLQNHGDVQQFVQAFSGDNRYIADYLIQEVLRAQPLAIRRFLLETAILDRLTGPLCDAVTAEHGSQTLLEHLEKSNLFVVPLDDTLECYRYHHLFAEVLRAHSIREHADQVRLLHSRASTWFERNGSLADALHHAVAADDAERVARLLEMKWPAMDRSYQAGRWLERAKTLSDAVVRDRPVLSMGYAMALLNVGELESVEARLDDVERWLRVAEDGERPDTHTGRMVIVDEQRWRSLPIDLATARVYLAQALGETSGTAEHARRLLQLMPEGDLAGRATGNALLGLAQWANGELEDAHETFSAALAGMRAAGNILDEIRGIFVLADIRVDQGRLHDAKHTYEQGLLLAQGAVHTAVPQTDELYLGLSELYWERGEVDTAARFLQTITESEGRTDYAGNRQRWCVCMARVAEARGAASVALDLLAEAESVDVRSPVPRLRPIPAMRARIWIAQGRLAEAMGWAKGMSVHDDLHFMREFEHITLARLLVARYVAEKGHSTIQDALTLLERLMIAASRGGRKGSVIEILVLEALAHQAMSNVRAALDPLERALVLGESEGYLRLFVDEGDPMRDLLRHAAARGVAGEYTRQVLRAFDEPVVPAPTPFASTARPVAATDRLVQNLTARELEILRLLAVGLRNLEIAEQLAISTATVKRHVANAYAKLDVSHRTQALLRAQALNLL
ncbi:MAG: helix-turn-helix transcriptional regulator [Gemmatimonadaceae bacterium]|nr:helix-turn-helix transcriptional regulator [Gemmatimonadaceae bacterium]